MGFNVFSAGTFALPLTLRKAVPADLPALWRMQQKSLRELSYGHYGPRQVEGFIAYFGTLEREVVEDGTYYVAEVGGWLAASGGWSLRAPRYLEAVNASDAAKRAAAPLPRIRSVFVHPDYAELNLARRLVQVCETEIRWRGYREVAHDASQGGRALYESLGYKALAPLPVALPDGTRLEFTHMRKRVSGRASRCDA
jgi:GNAT superfamily N-acetyltransferase